MKKPTIKTRQNLEGAFAGESMATKNTNTLPRLLE